MPKTFNSQTDMNSSLSKPTFVQRLVAPWLAALLLASAATLPAQTTAKIPEVLTADGRFTTLLAAVGAAGLGDTLNGDGPFTLFAPTDAAFAALPPGTVDALLANPAELSKVLLYHVVAGELPASSVIATDKAVTVQGRSIYFTVEAGPVVKVNQATVIETDIDAANGVIHVIDAVLLPPGKIPQVLTERGDFTTLLTAVGAADLADTLNSDGPFTLLAPTDAAFAAVPSEVLNALLADPAELARVLLYHVISGEVPASTVVTLTKATTVQGNSVTISVEGGNVRINNALVTVTDIEAENGIIHVLDAVLLPPGRIPEVLAERGDFNTLLTAVAAADLVDTLNGDGPFTLLAPTDAAFAAVPSEILNALLADPAELAQVLLYHVISGNVPASTVVTLDQAVTVQGNTVRITVNNGNVMINDAMVTITDIEARNGIIHVLDAVLLPPGRIPQVLTELGNFNTLLTAVGVANLADTLTGDGPFTLFAPTDAAFAAVPEETLNALLADPEALAKVLLYHVVADNLSAAEVVAQTKLKTVLGKRVAVTVNGQTVQINNATVTGTDFEARNGVIHVIDAVLLPPGTIPEVLTEQGNFSTLLTAVGVAGLAETLSGAGPFTLFAPTDAAFAAVPEETLNTLLADPAALAQVLLYHVVPGELLAEDVVTIEAAKTASGKSFRITTTESGVKVNSANVTQVDLEAINGVIHVIDAVILPGQVVQFDVPGVSGNAVTLTWAGGNAPYTLQKKSLAAGGEWQNVLTDTTETTTTQPIGATPEIFRVLETPVP